MNEKDAATINVQLKINVKCNFLQRLKLSDAVWLQSEFKQLEIYVWIIQDYPNRPSF